MLSGISVRDVASRLVQIPSVSRSPLTGGTAGLDPVTLRRTALESGFVDEERVGGLSVNELYGAIRDAVGVPTDAHREAARPGEQLRSCLDAAKLSAAAGWRAETPLALGIARTVDYFRGA